MTIERQLKEKKKNDLIDRLTRPLEKGPVGNETPAQFLGRVDKIKRTLRTVKRELRQ